eukprot:scaffold2668_cov115-Isochrysis_galbana.AAC.8
MLPLEKCNMSGHERAPAAGSPVGIGIWPPFLSSQKRRRARHEVAELRRNIGRHRTGAQTWTKRRTATFKLSRKRGRTAVDAAALCEAAARGAPGEA